MPKIILLTLLLACGTVQAGEAEGYITAEEVGSWCEPYKTATVSEGHVNVNATDDSRVCFGAFIAVQQLTILKMNTSTPVLGSCIAPEVRLTELIKVFLRYLEVHPEKGHQRFSTIVLASLRGAYPC